MNRRGTLLAVLLLALSSGLVGQGIDMDQLAADDEFRAGVVALNFGEFANAVFSFNRSLSYKPESLRTRFWLGRAFYYSGYEEEALAEWRWVADNGDASAFLQSRIGALERSRMLDPAADSGAPGRYVTMEEISGVREDAQLFRGPTSVRPRADGSFYLVSFATHQIMLMDVNGVRRRIIDGGLEGLDQPFDVAPLAQGGFLVSEFGADRIARFDERGFKTGTFGSSGRSDGQLIGPQYLSLDDSGYLYVSDYGNRRIVKFDDEGRYILQFNGGRATGTGDRFRFSEPAGVAALGDMVYVADTGRGTIEAFDSSGNHLDTIRHALFEAPEALTAFEDRRLLICDTNRLIVLDPERQEASLVSTFGPTRRVLGAAMDANGHILAADFAGSDLLFLADGIELGLTPEIAWVDASGFPRIVFAVAVSDAWGRPILGLGTDNFLVTEDRFPVGDERVVYASHANDQGAYALLVDGSAGMHGDDVRRAAGEFLNAVGDQPRWVVSTAGEPAIVAEPGTPRLTALEAAVSATSQGGELQLDRAIRLAVSGLYRHVGSQGIVFVTSPTVASDAFATYGLIETAAMLRTNRVTFSVVSTDRSARSDELEYLVRETGGSWTYLYQPEGSGVVVDSIAGSRPGLYVLETRSVHDSDFGRAYIPLEVRVDLIGRSGVDEAGYFGALEF